MAVRRSPPQAALLRLQQLNEACQLEEVRLPQHQVGGVQVSWQHHLSTVPAQLQMQRQGRTACDMGALMHDALTALHPDPDSMQHTPRHTTTCHGVAALKRIETCTSQCASTRNLPSASEHTPQVAQDVAKVAAVPVDEQRVWVLCIKQGGLHDAGCVRAVPGRRRVLAQGVQLHQCLQRAAVCEGRYEGCLGRGEQLAAHTEQHHRHFFVSTDKQRDWVQGAHGRPFGFLSKCARQWGFSKLAD